MQLVFFNKNQYGNKNKHIIRNKRGGKVSGGVIFGKITNIFNGLVNPSLDYDQEEVAGIFVDKWIENNKELEIKRNINDKTNIYRQDMIYGID